MRTLEEIYGVPSFETCKKLSEYWKEETLFMRSEENEKRVYNSEELRGGYTLCYKTYKCPQINELLEALQKEIEPFQFNHSKNVKLGIILTDKEIYFYIGYIQYIHFHIDSTNTLVECLAKIYITLKKQNL